MCGTVHETRARIRPRGSAVVVVEGRRHSSAAPEAGLAARVRDNRGSVVVVAELISATLHGVVLVAQRQQPYSKSVRMVFRTFR